VIIINREEVMKGPGMHGHLAGSSERPLGRLLDLEVTKRVCGISVRLWEVCCLLSWRSRPLPEQRKRCQITALGRKEDCGTPEAEKTGKEIAIRR
jgi:hypothetical protein